MKELQRIIKKHFGISALSFIVCFAEFQHPLGPIEANCRIYAVFVDEQVLFTWRKSGDQVNHNFHLSMKP